MSSNGTFPQLLFVAALTGVAGIISAIVILFVRPFLLRYALARPNARSSHLVPTPQGGGIGVVFSVIVTASPVIIITHALSLDVVTLMTAIVGLAVVGAADDVFNLGVGSRLLVQAIAIIAVITALPPELRIVHAFPLILERGLMFLALLWFVNLVNFMDGIDLITVAEVVPISAALAYLGIIGELPPSSTVIALALFGAILGFAPFNRPPARLFLGDVGSLPIGLIIGWLLVMLASNGHLMAAMLLPLYYTADATLTFVRRIYQRENVLNAHRSHFYQRATWHGLTVSVVVGQVFFVNLLLAGLAIASIKYESQATSFLAGLFGSMLVGMLLLRFSRPNLS